MRWIVLLALLVACGDDSDATDAAVDTGVDANVDTGPGDADVEGMCSALDRAACAYVPERESTLDGSRDATIPYTDVTGATREVFIQVRRPADVVPNGPLVVWSHGGSGGRTTPGRVGTGWGRVFAEAGYVSIAIAHPGREHAEVEAICNELSWGDCARQTCTDDVECVRGEEVGTCASGTCRYVKIGNWDRPHDVAAVLSWIEDEADGGELDGIVDPSRIVYAGHSAGAGATMMLAGATRRYRPGGEDFLLIDTRPIAFVSCSPQGPGDDGFTDTSFDRASCEALADPAESAACFSRPHLTLTGVGDSDIGESRRQSFDLAPDGERFLGYITEGGAQHETFNFEVESCEMRAAREGITPSRCADYLAWLRSSMVAFLDATLRSSTRARAWLRSTNPSILSGGVMSWELKETP